MALKMALISCKKLRLTALESRHYTQIFGISGFSYLKDIPCNSWQATSNYVFSFFTTVTEEPIGTQPPESAIDYLAVWKLATDAYDDIVQIFKTCRESSCYSPSVIHNAVSEKITGTLSDFEGALKNTTTYNLLNFFKDFK